MKYILYAVVALPYVFVAVASTLLCVGVWFMGRTHKTPKDELAKCCQYLEGKYRVPPPPVGHEHWSVWDWISYIDKHGEWTNGDDR